jgi:hypothetical protein
LSRALSAVAVTAVGTYFALQPRDPAPAHHDHDDHGEEKHDGEGEKEESAEEQPKGEGEGGDEKPNSEGIKEEEAAQETTEQTEPKDSAAETADAQHSGESGSPGVSMKGATKNKEDVRRSEDDPLGKKKRIDSPQGKPIGEGVSASKDLDEGTKFQAGMSNTDTKHSEDVSQDPGKSKKGEGTVDTAKVKGTIKPDRPQV